jgi:hypothetical protein
VSNLSFHPPPQIPHTDVKAKNELKSTIIPKKLPKKFQNACTTHVTEEAIFFCMDE